MFKTRGGGGVKGRLNNVKKKLHYWSRMASLIMLKMMGTSVYALIHPFSCVFGTFNFEIFETSLTWRKSQELLTLLEVQVDQMWSSCGGIWMICTKGRVINMVKMYFTTADKQAVSKTLNTQQSWGELHVTMVSRKLLEPSNWLHGIQATLITDAFLRRLIDYTNRRSLHWLQVRPRVDQ